MSPPDCRHPGIRRNQILLGSRSPRRRDLLTAITGSDDLKVLPPLVSGEAGFADTTTDAEIECRLRSVVRAKHNDVLAQANTLKDSELHGECSGSFLITADTIVIASPPHGDRRVLGQPHPDLWREEVREWFLTMLSGRTHEVWTGILISSLSPDCHSEFTSVVRTKVTFCDIPDDLLDWYLSTEESPGKAGGYAIQGHAAVFVNALHGSLTNVIGLPVQEVLQGLKQLGWQREL